MISLDNFIIEFESEDQDKLDILWQHHKPKSIKDFLPNDQLL